MSTLIVRSEQAAKLVTLGRKHHHRYKVLDKQGVITEPLYENEWLYVPLAMETRYIPHEAIVRLEQAEKSGIPIAGTVVGHEAPRLLTAPRKIHIDFNAKPLLAFATTLLAGFFAAARVVLAVFGLLFVTILQDPCLIVILSDGTWVSLCEWTE